MTNLEHQHNPQEQEHHWMKDQELVQRIIDQGAQTVIESAPQPELAKDKPCGCIDERVNGFKIGVAGSGILHPQQEAVDILKNAGITSISSHQDCGAANLAFQNLSEQEQAQYGSADNYAIEWTKTVAQQLGIPYDGHKPVETPGQHVARAIYYDASGEFLADQPNLPKGFTITRKYLDKADAQASLALSMKIAFGDHGFKDKFNPENPLIIVPIGTAEELESIQEEIYQVLKSDMEAAEKVHLDSGVVINKTKAVAA